MKAQYAVLLAVAMAAGTALPLMAAQTQQPAQQAAAKQNFSAAAALVEGYFNSLTTWQADFEQVQSDQPQIVSRGVFYLAKPGKFLWQYVSPVKQKVVGTGTAVYYADESSRMGPGQVTQLPMDAGLGRLLRGKALKLPEAGLEVVAESTSGARRTVTLAPRKGSKQAEGMKQLALTFRTQGQTNQLVSFSATDVVGVTTTVRFSNQQSGHKLDKKLFAFTPPLQSRR